MVSIHVQYQVRHYWNKRDKILSGGRLPRLRRYLIRQDTFTRWDGKTTFDMTSLLCQNVEPHTCACRSAQRAQRHIPACARSVQNTTYLWVRTGRAIWNVCFAWGRTRCNMRLWWGWKYNLLSSYTISTSPCHSLGAAGVKLWAE